jgi:predicted enzyme related to lactoylglutathione lyase
MTFVKLAIAAIVVAAATLVAAQEAPVRVWGVRVLATDVEALATFYAKTFGLSETDRPVNSATTKEIILNVGATPDVARKATTVPVVIYTRPASAPAGAMASLILRVADLEKTIEAVKVNGGTLLRGPNRNAVMNLAYAFVKDPDGNQIELIMEAR